MFYEYELRSAASKLLLWQVVREESRKPGGSLASSYSALQRRLAALRRQGREIEDNRQFDLQLQSAPDGPPPK
jgi:hypothetical protein